MVGPAQCTIAQQCAILGGVTQRVIHLSVSGKDANALEDSCHSWDGNWSGLSQNKALMFIMEKLRREVPRCSPNYS